MSKINSILIAKILIFISFILFLSSAIFYYYENKNLVNSKQTKSLDPTQEEINITTKGEDVQENLPESNGSLENEVVPIEDNNLTNNDNDIASSNNQMEPNYVPDPNFNVNDNSNEELSNELSISEVNNNLRNTIQDNYGIKILYGNETSGYRVGGLQTYPEEDEYTIQSTLKSLANLMEVYPYGFFQEIKAGGIPLTLYLINSYSESGVTGATNAFNNKADISIALKYEFAESFNHEVLHYIEKFIKKNGDNFNSWITLNPFNFKYGSINGNLSYNKTFSADAPFVNNYAQASAEEDRASTFEYMMAPTKASCLNKEKTVWRKAEFIAQKIDLVFNTVSPNVTEYWERFIY